MKYPGLLKLKKLIKVALNLILTGRAKALHRIGLTDFPPPPHVDMRRTGGVSLRHYYESGLKTVLPIATTAIEHGVGLDQHINILDFGCGAARQLLHFCRDYPAPAYYACDVNPHVIAFVKKWYPRVEAHCSNFYPPLLYQDGFFDMVYSVSIFSHIDPVAQQKWLKELARVLKPSGYCFLTVEGSTSLSQMMREDPNCWPRDSLEVLQQKGFLYRPYKDFQAEKADENSLPAGSKYMGIENSYGGMVFSRGYIQVHWPTHGFRVHGIIEGIIDCSQNLVILQKDEKEIS